MHFNLLVHSKDSLHWLSQCETNLSIKGGKNKSGYDSLIIRE